MNTIRDFGPFELRRFTCFNLILLSLLLFGCDRGETEKLRAENNALRRELSEASEKTARELETIRAELAESRKAAASRASPTGSTSESSESRSTASGAAPIAATDSRQGQAPQVPQILGFRYSEYGGQFRRFTTHDEQTGQKTDEFNRGQMSEVTPIFHRTTGIWEMPVTFRCPQTTCAMTIFMRAQEGKFIGIINGASDSRETELVQGEDGSVRGTIVYRAFYHKRHFFEVELFPKLTK